MTELTLYVEPVFGLRRFALYFLRKTPQPANQLHNIEIYLYRILKSQNPKDDLLRITHVATTLRLVTPGVWPNLAI